MEEHESHDSPSRREIVQGMALLGLLGVTGGVSLGAAAEVAQGTDADYEVLKKVLIERLLNTRYYISPDGAVVVLLDDEVWPGDEGGAYHQDWLFDPDIGFKANPEQALSDTVLTDIEHVGIPADCNLDEIHEILAASKRSCLLDDANLIYRVLREKIHVETHGAEEGGLQKFSDWVGQAGSLSDEQKVSISAAVGEYSALPRPQIDHDFY